MMIPCQKAARLSSESRDRRLSGYERISLWLHLRMCGICRNFHRQLEILGEASKALAEAMEGLAPMPEAELSEGAREKMRQALRGWES